MTSPDSSVPGKLTFYAFLVCRFFATIATQILAVIVGWYVYDLSRSPMALGFVGLAQFVPMASLILPAGDIADRRDRRVILSLSYALVAVTAALLGVLALNEVHHLWLIFIILGLLGMARAFAAPTGQALLPLLVTPAELPKAIASSSSTFQVAVIAGPALGGFLYHLGPGPAFLMCASVAASASALTFFLNVPKVHRPAPTLAMVERVKEGISFIRRTPIIFGALSLDLFAVLFGGATALLPIYARDILHVGPEGLGLLRSAPAVGAALVGFALIRWPLNRHAGPLMFASVAAFGLATLVFGLSTAFWLSLIALVVLGAVDMVSVYIRHSLVQLATPDAMRGRVSSVNVLFIGASNELGEFESGLLASFVGAVGAVVLGAVATFGIVGLWMVWFPELVRVHRLRDVQSSEPKPEQSQTQASG